MGNISKASKLIFQTLTHPSQITVILRHTFRMLHPVKADEEHLSVTMNWLKRSQDVTSGGGCSGIYAFKEGWRPPYPETTGYIIETFLKYHELTGDTDYLERAIKMGDWEIDIQLPTGAVRGGVGITEYPIVFNTGQVIHGWVALFDKTGNVKYRESAERAAGWLISNLDSDGKWSKNTYNGVPHAYNVRVAWALMEVSRITGIKAFREGAEKNIRWVLSQAKPNDWIDFMGFTLEEQPFTHTIAYTLRGLLECSMHTGGDLKNEIQERVIRTSVHILDSYDLKRRNRKASSRFLPGAFSQEWKPDDSFSCLTGNAQLAIIWLKLYRIRGDRRYLIAAMENIDQVKSTQNLRSKNKGIRGGVAGSYPIWGRYVNYGYPNWAAKFLADALMLKKEVMAAEK